MDTLIFDFDLPFEEAIAWSENRVSVLPADYYGVLQEQARARAFTVSGLTAINQIQDALDGLTKVLKDGVTFDEWRKTIVQDPQMLALGKARLETIFRTNIQTNYSIGRTQQQRENVANRPFLMYDAINDARTRPNHMALDNFIAPATDPIWRKITPPNGFNSILPWQRVTGNFSMALKAFYSGKICEVRCRSGISFSVTAQHPILTDSGWVDAANLSVGSNLLRYSGEVYSGSASTNPNKNYLPFTIKEIFDALASGGTCTMPRASFNLNGDVRFFDGDVDVVCADWKLSAGLKPDISQLREQIDLISSNMNKCLASCESGSDIISLGSLSDIADSLHALAQSGFSLSFDKNGALIKFDPVVLHKDRYSLSVDFVDSLKFPECDPLFILLHDAFRDRLPTFALLYSSSRPTNDRTYLGFGALRDAGVCNVFVGGFAVNTNAHRDVFDCHPGSIELDDVVDLVTRDYSGHVYDLESKSGFIVVQSPDSKMQQSGVLVSNCRCAVISLTEAQARKRGWKGFTEYRANSEPDKGWDYNPADSQDARLDKIMADRLAKANPAVVDALKKKPEEMLNNDTMKQEPVPPPWEPDFPQVTIHTTVSGLKKAGLRPGESPDDEGRSPLYFAAKKGDAIAARKVAQQLIKEEKVLVLQTKHPDAILVPVHEVETGGKNKLPRALADVMSDIGNWPVDTDIVQVMKVSHTGAKAAERLTQVPMFDGPVKAGQEYIIIDDVTTSGSTLSALRHYIAARGGKVVHATSFATTSSAQTGYGGYLAPLPETLDLVRKKFDTNALNALLSSHGIATSYAHITNSQAKYILRFKDLESIKRLLSSPD